MAATAEDSRDGRRQQATAPTIAGLRHGKSDFTHWTTGEIRELVATLGITGAAYKSRSFLIRSIAKLEQR